MVTSSAFLTEILSPNVNTSPPLAIILAWVANLVPSLSHGPISFPLLRGPTCPVITKISPFFVLDSDGWGLVRRRSKLILFGLSHSKCITMAWSG